MKEKSGTFTVFFAVLLFFSLCASCGVSNKSIKRQQQMEEGVSNPTTIEELKDAISRYQERAADIQLANSQIGIWYKLCSLIRILLNCIF